MHPVPTSPSHMKASPQSPHGHSSAGKTSSAAVVSEMPTGHDETQEKPETPSTVLIDSLSTVSCSVDDAKETTTESRSSSSNETSQGEQSDIGSGTATFPEPCQDSERLSEEIAEKNEPPNDVEQETNQNSQTRDSNTNSSLASHLVHRDGEASMVLQERETLEAPENVIASKYSADTETACEYSIVNAGSLRAASEQSRCERMHATNSSPENDSIDLLQSELPISFQDNTSDIVSIASSSDNSDAGSDYDKCGGDSDDSDSEPERKRKPSKARPNCDGEKMKAAMTPRECVHNEVKKHLRKRMEKKRKAQEPSTLPLKALKQSVHDDVSKAAPCLFPGVEVHPRFEHNTDEAAGCPSNTPSSSTHCSTKSYELDALDFDTKRMLSSLGHRKVNTVRKIFGYGQAKMVDGMVDVKQLASTLRPKQVFAIHWMIKQEEIPIGLRGGILAADMGTGKTIMSLAVIASNKPDDDDKKEYGKATLVVVPNHDVAQQWQKEISKHCRADTVAGTTIFNNKVKTSPPCFFKKQRIVIATYNDLRNQRPSYATVTNRDKNWNDRKWRRKMERTTTDSPLFSVGWYRVVLDEGHKIKNMRTQTFAASADLKTKYRWCLTGTPLTNTDEELFSYLTFLSCDFAKKKGTFYEKFKQEHQDAVDKKVGKRPNLDALVATLMYRLPNDDNMISSTQQDIIVPVAIEEHIVINKMDFSKGRVGINFRRQGFSHIFALDLMMLQARNLSGLAEELDEQDNRVSALQLLRSRASKDPAIAQFTVGFNRMSQLGNDTICGPFDFAPLLKAMAQEQTYRAMTCTKCKVHLESMRTFLSAYCRHAYCSDCLQSDHIGQDRCAEEGCNVALIQGNMPDTFSYLEIQAKAADFQFLGQDNLGYDLRIPREMHPSSLLGDLKRVNVPPSTKLTMAMAIMLTWRQTHPNDKIIAFLSFRSSARVLGQMLRHAGESFIYKFGSMGDSRGTAALDSFKNSTFANILVAGLDCCAEALNLTEANRVLLIDLGWNKAKEEQAFARVNRSGQTKPTHFVRLVSEGDDRVVDIQEQKRVETDYAMRRDKHKVKRLSAEQYNALLAPELAPEPESDDDVVSRHKTPRLRPKRKHPRSEEIIKEEPVVKSEPGIQMVVKVEPE